MRCSLSSREQGSHLSMNALSGCGSKRYFRISEHHPRWTSDRTFCVEPGPVWFYNLDLLRIRRFGPETLAPFLLSIVKGDCPADIPGTRRLEATSRSCNSAMKLEGP